MNVNTKYKCICTTHNPQSKDLLWEKDEWYTLLKISPRELWFITAKNTNGYIVRSSNLNCIFDLTVSLRLHNIEKLCKE